MTTITRTKLTDRELTACAAVLGICNAGSESAVFQFGERRYLTSHAERVLKGSQCDLDTLVFRLVSGLCENDAMLETFQDEARSWHDNLKTESREHVLRTWPTAVPVLNAVSDAEKVLR